MFGSKTVASLGGLMFAVQVIVKYMDQAEQSGTSTVEKEGPEGSTSTDSQLALDLVRVAVQLLADACYNCPENCLHVFQMHIVRIVHELIIRFKTNPAITKATCCLAINLCHNDPTRQQALGGGILKDLVSVPQPSVAVQRLEKLTVILIFLYFFAARKFEIFFTY